MHLLALLVPLLATRAYGKSCVSDKIGQLTDTCALYTELTVCQSDLQDARSDLEVCQSQSGSGGVAGDMSRGAVVMRGDSMFVFATSTPKMAFDDLEAEANEAFDEHDEDHSVIFSYTVDVMGTQRTFPVKNDRDLWRALSLAKEMDLLLALTAEITTPFPSTTPTVAPTVGPSPSPTPTPTCSLDDTSSCREGDVVLFEPTQTRGQIQGLVLTWHNGNFGTVCDDVTDCNCSEGGCTSGCDNSLVNGGGGVNLAQVVCRQLGFSEGTEIDIDGTSSGYDIVVDGTENHITGCSGSEDRLDECQWLLFGSHNCGHHEDVGVMCVTPLYPTPEPTRYPTLPPTPTPTCSLDDTSTCREGDVVLFEPTETRGQIQGLVLTWHNGNFGTVCDDVTDCNCSEGGCVSGCDNSLVNGGGGVNLAQVVCRQLGFSEGTEINIDGTSSGYDIVVDGTENHITGCSGSEDRLDECQWLLFGSHNCGHHEDVGVMCVTPLYPTPEPTRYPTLQPTQTPAPTTKPPCTVDDTSGCVEGDVVLFNPTTSGSQIEGLVLTWHNGNFGTICDDVTDCNCGEGGCISGCDNNLVNGLGGQNLAQVVCRELGYSGGTELNIDGSSTGYDIVVDGTQNHITGCNGDESRLKDCQWLSFGSHNCGHHEDVGVMCLLD